MIFAICPTEEVDDEGKLSADARADARLLKSVSRDTSLQGEVDVDIDRKEGPVMVCSPSCSYRYNSFISVTRRRDVMTR